MFSVAEQKVHVHLYVILNTDYDNKNTDIMMLIIILILMMVIIIIIIMHYDKKKFHSNE